MLSIYHGDVIVYIKTVWVRRRRPSHWHERREVSIWIPFGGQMFLTFAVYICLLICVSGLWLYVATVLVLCNCVCPSFFIC